MAKVNHWNIPEDYYYNIDRHVWARIEADGTVTIGITDLAQWMAGQIFYAKVKPAGKKIAQFQGVATIETGQFIGAVPACVGGEIIMPNDQLPTHPTLINEDPYGKGWIARVQPTHLEAQLAQLITGQAAVEAYREKMLRENMGKV